MEDFYMIVIPQHQGFIEGDQTLAMGILSVNRTKERGRQGLLQHTHSTNPEKMLFTTTIPTFPQY